MESELYCNNCGNIGHIYKECKFPIMSYGHIIMNIEENKILMIQRKDSLCYIEFLRGKYDIYNLKYIQILINKFSISEKEKILKYDFDKLWEDLWLIDDKDFKKKYKIKNDYIKGKEKFIKLKEGYLYHKLNKIINLEYFIKRSETEYKDTEWEFPKGRRNNKESNLNCSIREFKEETNYDKEDYILLKNISPFVEEYKGENGVRYKHIYYIGYLINKEKEIKIDYNNEDQYTEIKDIKWLTKEESLNMIRNYHYTREKVIKNIFELLQNIKDESIIIK